MPETDTGPRRANGDARAYENKKTGRFELSVELPPGPSGSRRRKKVSGAIAAATRRAAKAGPDELELRGTVTNEDRTVAGLLEEWLIAGRASGLHRRSFRG